MKPAPVQKNVLATEAEEEALAREGEAEEALAREEEVEEEAVDTNHLLTIGLKISNRATPN